MIKAVIFATLASAALTAPSLPAVPGLAAHQAAEAALKAAQAQQALYLQPGYGFQYPAEQRVRQQQYDLSQPIAADVPGLAAHQAAEAIVLATQGRNPGTP